MNRNDSLATLLDRERFGAYLRRAIELHFGPSRRVNLSELSRRAGFSSRSYLGELVAGKKGLSRDGLSRIRSALKLPRPYLDLLELLAYREFPQLASPRAKAADIESQIDKVRERLRTPPIAKGEVPLLAALIRNPRFYQLYAALGSLERGATIEAIVKRVGRPRPRVEADLAAMVGAGFVERRGDRYFAARSQLDFFGLKSAEGLSHLCEEVTSRLRLNRKPIIDDPRNLIFYTAFSVDGHRLAALRDKLQTAVYTVLDEFQEDEGECVRQLFFCLGPPV